MTLQYDDARRRLARHKQEHVLKFWDRLDAGQRAALLAQVESLDFAQLARMRELLSGGASTPDAGFEPAPVVRLTPAEQLAAGRTGQGALRAGKVAVLLVAGGQGTRLGFDGPKGAFPIGPISNAPLFQVHARKILALERRHGAQIPFYIMTSDANHAATTAFFARHSFFGLAPDRVRFFTQGQLPALWPDGRIVLERTERIFMGPDGHGGLLAAMQKQDILADMAKRGTETVFYFQVDNPLVEIADPVFIGAHISRRADMSVKVCAKRGPDEGLGVTVTRGTRVAIMEYTELTAAQKTATLANGELKFKYGSVAIHVFSADFLRRETAAGLPFHLAHKKVPHCDDDGNPVKPEKPNAYKFEKFIFDALPDAREVLVMEFARDDEFSPVKNASGADSPETARRDMIRKWGGWIEACGVKLPRGATGDPACRIEIDPCYANSGEEFREKLGSDFKVAGDILLV